MIVRSENEPANARDGDELRIFELSLAGRDAGTPLQSATVHAGTTAFACAVTARKVDQESCDAVRDMIDRPQDRYHALRIQPCLR